MDDQSGTNEYTHQRMLRIVATAERLGYAEDEELYNVDDRGHGVPGAGYTLAHLRELVRAREAAYDKIEEVERWGFDPEHPPDDYFEE